MRDVLVLFGSETGNAMDAAERVGREAKSRGFSVRVLPADFYMGLIENLPNEDVVICIVSTTGQGEFPKNCSRFWRFLRKKSLSNNSLSNLTCGVFGLGDSGYPKYNYSAKLIHKRLGTLGASFLVPLGLGDDQHAHGYDASLDLWLSALWSALGVPESLSVDSEKLESRFLVETVVDNNPEKSTAPQGQSQYFDSLKIGNLIRTMEENSWQENAKHDMQHEYRSKRNSLLSSTVLQNTRMTPLGHFQDVRLLTIELPCDSHIKPGDSIGIWPKQNEQDVQIVLDRCGLRYDDTIRITYCHSNQDRESSFEQSIVAKAGNIIEGFVDIKGAPPRRTFLRVMSQLCPDGMHKERLLHLSSAQGREDFYEYVMQEGRNLLDVLADFPCVSLHIDWILSYAPRLQCRYYSASSFSKHQSRTVDMLAALVEWKTPGRRLRKGLSSRTIASSTRGAELVVEMAQGDLKSLPLSTPLILVGPGTGIAPLRSFLQERQENLREGLSPIGPCILFFGCRDRSKDYFFEEEWKSMLSDGVLTDVIVAPSRENTSKMYVQDAIDMKGSLVWEYIQNGAHIYVCGRAGKMPAAVETSLLQIACKVGKLPATEAKKLIGQRQHVECWS